MAKIKSFFEYLVSKDVLEYRNLYYNLDENKTLTYRISHYFGDSTDLFLRYFPIPFELDAMKKIF